MSTLRTTNIIHGSSSVSNIVLDNQGRAIFGPDSPQGRAALYVNAQNNRVGVNTESPGVALDVAGAINATGNVAFGGTLDVTGTVSFDGNVGIGTSSPARKLVVNGGASEGVAQFTNNTSGVGADDGFQILHFTNGLTRLLNRENGAIAFSTNNTEVMRIDSSGNVGIGCDDPQYQLDLSTSDIDHLFTGAINAEQDGGDYALKLTALGKSGGRTGSVRFITGESTSSGTERMRIDSSGNVGIGVTSPSVLLHIASNEPQFFIQDTNSSGDNVTATLQFRDSSNTQLSYFGYAGSSDSHLSLFNTMSGGDLRFGTASTEKMRIDTSGRLLIGTATSGKNSAKLQIVGGDNTNHIEILNTTASDLDGQRYSYIWFRGTQSGGEQSSLAFIGSVHDGSADDQKGRLIFHTNDGNDGESPTEAMRVDSSGRLLVGLTSNANTAGIQVKASSTAEGITIVGRDTDDIGQLNFYEADLATNLGEVQYRQDHANIRHRIGGIRFATGGTTERMRLNSTGQLLIGTQSQADNNHKLELCNTFGGRMGFLRNDTTTEAGNNLGMLSFFSNDSNGIYQEAARIAAEADLDHATGSKPGRLVFYTTPNSSVTATERMRIRQDGQTSIENSTDFYPGTDNATGLGAALNRWTAVYAVNGTIQTSDSRQKKNIVDAQLGTDFIKALRPVSYQWIEGGKRQTGEYDENNNCIYETVTGQRTHWGFIAQEVKQSVDDAGVDFGGWVLTDKDDPDSEQSLRYDQFIAPLTKALQEAIAKIEDLETRIATLENS